MHRPGKLLVTAAVSGTAIQTTCGVAPHDRVMWYDGGGQTSPLDDRRPKYNVCPPSPQRMNSSSGAAPRSTCIAAPLIHPIITTITCHNYKDK